MRRVLAVGTLGPTLLVDDEEGQPTLVAKLITTVVGDDAVAFEATLSARLSAPLVDAGLVPVVATGVDAAGAYIVTPFVEGPTLESRLRGGRQSLAQVLEWLTGPGGALVAAHAQGRLHGALHPRDILLPRGRGVLTGLDISPALETLGLQAPVRVPFTAPERASGKPWNACADQYSLAMLALDALSGRRLIAGTIPAFDRWTLADTPAEDARLHDVFARALHPDAEQRFTSVAEWLEALVGAAEPTSELSRFTRDGVIPAAALDVRRPPQTEMLDEAMPLALFPAEHPSGASDDFGADIAPPDVATVETDRQDVPVSPTGEWLVASMPEDAAPLADTGPMPIQSLSHHAEDDETIASPVPAAEESAAGADDFSLHHQTYSDDGVDGAIHPTEDGTWQESDLDDEPRRRSGVLIAVVFLIIGLLAFGTWRSLTRSSTDDTGLTGSAVPSGPGTDSKSTTPEPLAEEPLRPSAEDLRPGVGSAERPPARTPVPTPSRPPAASPAPRPSAPVVAPPATPAETPLAEDRGRVLIRSSPAGQVRVNGRQRGQTPLVLRDLPFGSYEIVISRPGYVDAVRQFNVLRSQPVASIFVYLEQAPAGGAQAPPAAPDPSAPVAPGAETPPPGVTAAPGAAATGSLYVVSRPVDARLFIDGQAYGTAPAVVPALRAGRHVIRVELPGYRAWEGSIDVQPGQRVRVDATLVREQQ